MSDFHLLPLWTEISSTQNPFLTSRFVESTDNRKFTTNGYKGKLHILDRYQVVGFISSGTYGRVYKAIGHNGQRGEFAIKK